MARLLPPMTLLEVVNQWRADQGLPPVDALGFGPDSLRGGTTVTGEQSQLARWMSEARRDVMRWWRAHRP